MKKLTILATLALTSCLSAFGQGYFQFTSSASTAVWMFNGSSYVKAGGNTYMSLMWSANTNASPLTGGLRTPTNSVVPVSWGEIAGDANFQMAHRDGTNLVALTGTGLGLGFINQGVVPLDGTAPGQLIELYAIAWDSASGIGGVGNTALLGWSNPFFITLGSSQAPGSSLAGAGMQAFGLQVVPEPATFALAGLGAAALLIFRRRRQ